MRIGPEFIKVEWLETWWDEDQLLVPDVSANTSVKHCGLLCAALLLPRRSTQSSNTVSERRAADAVQREVQRVVGRREHVRDLHRQVDLGV